MREAIQNVTLLRREVLVSLLILGFAGTALGGMTWSYYADSDDSTGNTLQADAMDLRIDGSDSLSSTFTITSGSPGSSASHTYDLTNNGGVTADHVEVSFSYAENDPGSEPGDSDLNVELGATETASLVRVTTLEYRNDAGTVLYDATSDMSDGNGNGVIDLEDVQNHQSSFDDLAAPQPNGGNTTKLAITVQLVDDDGGAFTEGGNTAGSLTGSDEDLMADGVDVTITFTLNQDASQ